MEPAGTGVNPAPMMRSVLWWRVRREMIREAFGDLYRLYHPPIWVNREARKATRPGRLSSVRCISHPEADL
jgi:hypothetical protein